MTVKELRHFFEKSGITDDFELDIVGENSGSFGSILRLKANEVLTPVGLRKEIILFINA